MKAGAIKIVVVGGGFAGINLVKRLANDSRFWVTLVDQDNYHSFNPLFYQVAMAFIEPSNISYPFRRLFQEKENLRFHLGRLERVVPEDKRIETDTGALHYGYLVLAGGTESNCLGREDVRLHSWPLKASSDATKLGNRLRLNMAAATRTTGPEERRCLLN